MFNRQIWVDLDNGWPESSFNGRGYDLAVYPRSAALFVDNRIVRGTPRERLRLIRSHRRTHFASGSW